MDDASRSTWARRMLIRSAALAASHKWLVYAKMHRDLVTERYELADSADRFLHEIGPETEYWLPNSVEGVTDVWERVNNYIPRWAEMLSSGDRVKQLFHAASATVQRLSDEGERWVDELVVELRKLQAHGGQPQLEDAVAAIVTGFIEDPAVAREAFNLNLLLLGLPGSGKTTIARKIARVFGACGILVSGDRGDDRFVEIGRGDLVAQWAGQTAPRVTTLLTRNLERVVFLDEAYSVVAGAHDEIGQEALTALVQYMDQYKGQISIIAAGYEDRMRYEFLQANPGLDRRFPGQFVMARLSPQYLFGVLWKEVDERTFAFGGPLQIYDVWAYQLVREFIARARLVNAKPESIDALFHTQAAAATELAHRAIRYANEVRTRSLNGRLGALGPCSMARVLYDFTVSKISRPMDRLKIELYLSRKCDMDNPMQKMCNASGRPQRFGTACVGDAEANDDNADIECWQVVDSLADLLRGRGEGASMPRSGVMNAQGKMVGVPTAPPPPK
jgi:hypothetical protein